MYKAVLPAVAPAVPKAVAGDVLSRGISLLYSLPPYFTFTRASNGRYWNTTPQVATASNDVARFDTNPTTLAALGYLNEGSVTNNLLGSSNIGGTGWSTFGTPSITQNNLAAPNGATEATKLQASAGSSSFGTYQNFTYTAVAYTLSVYAKNGTYGYLALDFSNASTSGAVFDLSNGTVGYADAGITTAVQDCRNGWYRLSITKTLTAVASFPEVYLSGSRTANTKTWTAAGTEYCYMWGAQLEIGSGATSYIATTSGATATRSADSAIVSGSNFTTNFPNASTSGTLIIHWRPVTNVTSGGVMTFNDGTINNFIQIRHGTANPAQGVIEVTAGGVSQASLNLGSVFTAGSLTKLAIAWANNDIACCANGGTLQTTSSATIPSVNQFRLGFQRSGSVSGNGWHAFLQPYPNRLPNAVLQALTA